MAGLWGPWLERPRAGGGRVGGRRAVARIGTLSLALAAGVLAGTSTVPVRAADPEAELRALEERMSAEQATEQEHHSRREALATEVARLREQVIDSAAAIQDAEDTLTDLEHRLTALRDEREASAAALARRDRQMTLVMAAIQRLAARPTEALIVQPAPPADTVRSAILLRAAVPRIEDNARDLARQLERLQGLDSAILAQKAEITDKAEALRSAHARLEALVERKAALERDALEREREAAARVADLGREATDLRDLIARLEAERQRREALEAERRAAAARRRALEERQRMMELAEAQRLARVQAERDAEEREQANSPDTAAVATPGAVPEAIPDPMPASTFVAPPPRPAAVSAGPPRAFAQGQGAMPMPVRGRLVTRFGEHDDVGTESQGISILARAGAQVVAPYDGTVAFAGPFRGYGLLLIIEHTDGYHSLLAGMQRIDSRVGQTVRAGEPVGVMGSGEPALYIELRRAGRPINPLPWMAAGSDTGKG